MTYDTKWHIVSVNLMILIFLFLKTIFWRYVLIFRKLPTYLQYIYDLSMHFLIFGLINFSQHIKKKMIGQFISTEILIRNSEQCIEWKSVIPANEFFPLSNMKYCDVGLSDRVRIDYFNRNVSYLDFDEVQYFLQYRKSITLLRSILYNSLWMNL